MSTQLTIATLISPPISPPVFKGRLMAVHAHPDDESSKGAATMAKYVRAGHQVLVISCTGGERGDILNPGLKDSGITNLLEVRRSEMAHAQEILGVDHQWLGFEDSGFPQGDPLPPLPAGCFADIPVEIPAALLAEKILEFSPHVITTYDELGGYPHPDHIRTHEVTMAAVKLAADQGWQVQKIYFNQQFTRERLEVLAQAMAELKLANPYESWLQNWKDRRPVRITTRVECADFFEIRNAALIAHATQVDPMGQWFAVPISLQREVWPTEEFELAFSAVGEIDVSESDLFAGVEDDDE
ncbi:MAG: mycothiol conjugate amidase Mca [Actinobacteria bacterium]|nr:MAG: mycothiol conjugate amidase Mca [Actinomycetota bacterium]